MKKSFSKKSFYRSIFLSAVLLALGIQITNTTEAKADSEVTAVASTETSQVPVVTVEPTGGKQESADFSDSDTQTESFVPQETPEEKNIDGNQGDTFESTNKNGNDKELVTDVMIPHIKHDAKQVQIVDADGNLTGTVPAHEIYDGNTVQAASGYTDDIYSIRYGVLNVENPTPKVAKLILLTEQAMTYLKPENYGYANILELNDYFQKYQNLYDTINAYDDNGEPIKPVAPASHHSSSNQTLIDSISELNNKGSKNMEEVNMTVTANKKATLYTEKGDAVTNRGVQEDSTWHVDKIATINGKKMYRITDTEWIADEDVK